MARNFLHSHLLSIVTVLVVLAAAILYLGIVMKRSLDRNIQFKEETHATSTFIKILCQYVETNHSWPDSWDTLEKGASEPIEGISASWPDDRSYFEDNFSINFSHNLHTAHSQLQHGNINDVIKFPPLAEEVYGTDGAYGLIQCIEEVLRIQDRPRQIRNEETMPDAIDQ